MENKWEYRLELFDMDYSDERINALLNRIGFNEWEAVSMNVLPNGNTKILFKRISNVK